MRNILSQKIDERAVSPVVGVVLMVGIVVALGAVVGTAVLMTGTSIGDTAPQAQFEITQEGDTVTITHVSGDTIDPETIQVNGKPGTAVFGTEPISAGDSGTYTISDGETEVTVTSENGDNSAIVAEKSINTSPSIGGPTLETVTVIDEAFDDGTYTDTFGPTSGPVGGSGTQTVTSTDPVSAPNRLELNIDNPPTDGGVNGLSTLETHKNITEVSMDLNRSGSIQTSWEVGIQRVNRTTGELDVISLQTRPEPVDPENPTTPDEQIVYLVEQDENGEIQNTTVTRGLTRNEWKDISFEVTDDSVTATVNGNSATLDTVNNHNNMDNGVSVSAITQTDEPVQVRLDNIVVKSEQVVEE